MKIEMKNFQQMLENEFENYIQVHSKINSSEEHLKIKLNADLEKIKDSIIENINTSMIEKSKDDTVELTGFYYEKIMKWTVQLSEIKMLYSMIEESRFQFEVFKKCFSFFSKLLSDIELEHERYLDVIAKSKMRKQKEMIFFHRIEECEQLEKGSGFFTSKQHPIEPILNQELETYKN